MTLENTIFLNIDSFPSSSFGFTQFDSMSAFSISSVEKSSRIPEQLNSASLTKRLLHRKPDLLP